MAPIRLGSPLVMTQGTERIAYLTAGAAGMFCGSCLRDNALAVALSGLGCDVTLVPLYTPIRTDEVDVSLDRVFFGGINVYLQQKIPLFRLLPRALDRWLDAPWLLRRLAAGRIEVDARELGELTVSMLQGEHGQQRKEVFRLVDWLERHARPQLVNLSNILIAGCVPHLKQRLKVPVSSRCKATICFWSSWLRLTSSRRWPKSIAWRARSMDFWSSAVTTPISCRSICNSIGRSFTSCRWV